MKYGVECFLTAFQADFFFFFLPLLLLIIASSARLFKHNSGFYAWGRSSEWPKATIYLGVPVTCPHAHPPPPPLPQEMFFK